MLTLLKNQKNTQVNKDLIKILKPSPKVQPKDSESEIQSDPTQPQETNLLEEVLKVEEEPTGVVEPVSTRYAQLNPSGWKVSDVLREIRLDSF